MDSDHIRHLVQTTTDNVERVIIGKRREVELVLVALLCRGHGRDYVVPEDLYALAEDVLLHRMRLNYEALAEGKTGPMVLQEILDELGEASSMSAVHTAEPTARPTHVAHR